MAVSFHFGMCFCVWTVGLGPGAWVSNHRLLYFPVVFICLDPLGAGALAVVLMFSHRHHKKILFALSFCSSDCYWARWVLFMFCFVYDFASTHHRPSSPQLNSCILLPPALCIRCNEIQRLPLPGLTFRFLTLLPLFPLPSEPGRNNSKNTWVVRKLFSTTAYWERFEESPDP